MANPGYNPHTGEPYLSLQEATSLGYGAYQTLRGYIADGRLPAVKIGSRVKVLRSDLDALAVPQAVETTFPAHHSSELDHAIERLVLKAPNLSDTQLRRLAALLGGAVA